LEQIANARKIELLRKYLAAYRTVSSPTW